MRGPGAVGGCTPWSLVYNDNLADFMMTTAADCPEIDVSFTDFPDKVANSFGARGCGEIGLAGVAPAIYERCVPIGCRLHGIWLKFLS